MISYSTAAILIGAALFGYWIVMALIGAMYPPAPGEERTRYAYWYRVGQLMAANLQRAAEHRYGDLAGPPPDALAAIAAHSAAGGAVVAAVSEQRTEFIAAGGNASAR